MHAQALIDDDLLHLVQPQMRRRQLLQVRSLADAEGVRSLREEHVEDRSAAVDIHVESQEVVVVELDENYGQWAICELQDE